MTCDLKQRLFLHNSNTLNRGVTRKKIPWEYFIILEVESKAVALRIEKHIKNMKSRVYIQNLKKYPELAQNLIKKYS